MNLPTTPSRGRPAGRWIWVAFAALVVVPLYAVAVAAGIRSGIFRFGDGALTDVQTEALWAFVAAGTAAGATILAALLTKSHNDKTLALQTESEKRKQVLEADANERLKLDTVISGLNLICNDGKYAPKAGTAGGLAALVQLGHPIIAMRALVAALKDDEVDSDTATWLIGHVLTTTTTKGTPADLKAAKEEAASLLLKYAPTLTESDAPGRFSWPDAVTAQWPAGLSTNAASNLISGLVELLLSQSKSWWNGVNSTHTWIPYTLDVVVQTETNALIRAVVASVGKVVLEVTDDDYLSGLSDARPASEVAARIAAVPGQFEPDEGLCERIRAWGRGGTATGDPAPRPTPVPNPAST